MQHVPAFTVIAITIKLLVAGYTPNIAHHSMLLFQNLRRFEHFKHDRAAAEQLRPQFRILIC